MVLICCLVLTYVVCAQHELIATAGLFRLPTVETENKVPQMLPVGLIPITLNGVHLFRCILRINAEAADPERLVKHYPWISFSWASGFRYSLGTILRKLYS